MAELYDILVVGGGPAGLAAAVAAWKAGIKRILILEREHKLGGILNQCIHNGFGLHTFEEELTGPEYAARFIRQVQEAKIAYKTHTMVLDLSMDDIPSHASIGSDNIKKVTVINSREGVQVLKSRAVILAMGCRERPRGALNIPGYRPAGIFTAGTAQKYVNLEGYLPGKEVVILGSGDIGLIMARRMTLEGATVKVVAELMPYSGGLKRNIVQCLEDYHIPLKLSTTVVCIHGKERITGVTLAKVDGTGKPIDGTQEYVACDTLLLSVGLLPENELSSQAGVNLQPVTSGPVVGENLETNLSGIFACGNVLHVHDLVDYVSEEAAKAGENAARYCQSHPQDLLQDERKGEAQATVTMPEIPISPRDGVRYTVPCFINRERFLASGETGCKIRFRVGKEYRDAQVVAQLGSRELIRRRRKVMAPGEMEELVIKREWLMEQEKGTGELIIRIQEGEKNE